VLFVACLKAKWSFLGGKRSYPRKMPLFPFLKVPVEQLSMLRFFVTAFSDCQQPEGKIRTRAQGACIFWLY